MSAAAAAIEAAGLGRDYGQARALDALDLVVSPGELVGLLGPNGAGKTTAMLILATLLQPSRGRAAVFGHDVVRERAAVRRRLGLVFQDVSVDPLLTVRENLLFAAGLVGLGRAQARAAVEEVVVRTGLAERANDPARRLSGGWRRLTDIARATLHRPGLLILDEPTVGLDPEHRERMWHLIAAERGERGTAVLFSTHYLAEAEACDRVALLAHGRVVAEGAPGELIGRIGDHVVEVDGPGAERAVSLLEARGGVQVAIRTERGFRVGITGPYEDVGALVSGAGGISRFALRSATLEDVYFATTGRSAGSEARVRTGSRT